MYQKILILFFLLNKYSYVLSDSFQVQPRVCVIGAGMSGLSVAYNLQKAGLKHFDVYEASKFVGGTWHYEDRVGQDEYGYPIHSSMYKSLRTNQPRQTMEFPDFPMPPDISTFPRGPCFYNYIQAFADYFDLHKYIKLSHRVDLVTKTNNGSWLVKYRRSPLDEIEEKEYDYILVCSGHNFQPNWPDNIEEVENNFLGEITHSHHYREPEAFKDLRVLIVGAGPSAWDIGLEIATVASKLLHSHHSKFVLHTPFPSNYVRKPDIKNVTNYRVSFQDNTTEDVDVILYCTGYQYYYPYLDESSQLDLALQYVAPLYRNTVNINEPTMLFFGLGVNGVVTTAIHTQARYAASLIMGHFSLPASNVMFEKWQKQVDDINKNGKPLKALHYLNPYEKQYYEDMTTEARIDGVPTAFVYMGTIATEAKLNNWYTFRNYAYYVKNDTIFTVQPLSQEKPCNLNSLRKDSEFNKI